MECISKLSSLQRKSREITNVKIRISFLQLINVFHYYFLKWIKKSRTNMLASLVWQQTLSLEIPWLVIKKCQQMGKIKFAMQPKKKKKFKWWMSNWNASYNPKQQRKYSVVESQPELGFGVGQSGVRAKPDVRVWNHKLLPAKGACTCIFLHLWTQIWVFPTLHCPSTGSRSPFYLGLSWG